MKRNIILLVLFTPIIVWGQGEGFNLRYAIQSSNANFYDIAQSADTYFAANPDNTEGGGYAQYKRWKLFIELNYPTRTKMSWLDFTGKEVYSSYVNQATSIIDLSTFKNGLYFIVMNTGNETITQKIIINH